MLGRITKQLEKLKDQTLDENARLCGELEAKTIKKQKIWRTAWTMHILCFFGSLLLVIAIRLFERMVMHGYSVRLPSAVDQMFDSKGLTDASVKMLLIPVAILFFLPVVLDIFFAILDRAIPAKSGGFRSRKSFENFWRRRKAKIFGKKSQTL